jgi:iron-sulfur cluster assembly protein
MAISMTPAAAQRVSAFLTNRGKGIGLRVGIKTTGCSGMAYVLEFVDELNEDDNTYVIDGVTLVVDAKSLTFIDGTELDFQKEGLNEGFRFTNPNIKGECGCGESFTV